MLLKYKKQLSQFSNFGMERKKFFKVFLMKFNRWCVKHKLECFMLNHYLLKLSKKDKI